MNNIIINLEDYRTPNSKVFTGRDRGIDVRDKSKIDEIIKSNVDETITVIIPENVRSINPSFLEEFLFNVVSKFGKEIFFKRVVFKNNSDRYSTFENDLEEAVESILKENNSLGQKR